MQLEEKKRILEETIKGMLEKMGFKATVYTAIDATSSEYMSEGSSISVEIQVDDSNYLIGKHGVNLAALQHLCRVIVRKKSTEPITFTLDVNGYRQEHKQSIVRVAQEMARKALSDKKVMIMRPMSAYERRLVHIELAKMEGIQTESIGEGEERKVLIKPASLI